MKHIKQYENNLKWYYVICKEESEIELNVFLLSNIGQIINDNYTNPKYPIIVHYDISKESKDIKDYFRPVDGKNDANSDYFEDIRDFERVGKGGIREFSPYEILYHSRNKEDLEHIIAANKYNI